MPKDRYGRDLKVGDSVRVLQGDYNVAGYIGTVVSISNPTSIAVKMDKTGIVRIDSYNLEKTTATTTPTK